MPNTRQRHGLDCMLLLVLAFSGWVSSSSAFGQPQNPATPPPNANCPANSQGQVEIGWSVLPWKIVKDNFGHYVANKYFGVDLAIHNQSTCALIVNTFIFYPPGSNGDINGANLAVDPKLVRGSLEKGQLTGIRNIAVSAIKTTGLLATGASGFFKNVGSAASYNRGVAILSDPFEKGFELIFPDTTVKYLSNYDSDEVFKNGFVMSPGQTVKGRIFIPIGTVDASYAKKKANSFDSTEVKDRLGKIGVLGTQISGESTSFRTTGQ